MPTTLVSVGMYLHVIISVLEHLLLVDKITLFLTDIWPSVNNEYFQKQKIISVIHFCTNYSSSQVYESDHPCSRNISTRSSDSKVCCIYWTRFSSIQTAPSEPGQDQGLPGAEQSPDSVRRWRRQWRQHHHRSTGLSIQPPGQTAFLCFSQFVFYVYINYLLLNLRKIGGRTLKSFIWKMTFYDLYWYKTYSLISGRRTPMSKWKRYVNIHW